MSNSPFSINDHSNRSRQFPHPCVFLLFLYPKHIFVYEANILAHANADACMGGRSGPKQCCRQRRAESAGCNQHRIHPRARSLDCSHRKLSILQLFLLFTQQQADFQWIQFAPSQKKSSPLLLADWRSTDRVKSMAARSAHWLRD